MCTCVCVSGVLPTFSKHQSLVSVLVAWLIQRGSSYAAYVWALEDLCECARVCEGPYVTSSCLWEGQLGPEQWILNLQGAQTFHGQPKLFIYHKFTIYTPVPSTIIKTVHIGCGRNRVIQRGEKDWSLVQPVSWTQIICTSLEHFICPILMGKHAVSCLEEPFFFLLFFSLLLSVLVLADYFHKYKPELGL